MDNNILYCLTPPSALACPVCGEATKLLGGNIGNGRKVSSDSVYFLLCKGKEAYIYAIRLLSAIYKKSLAN